MYRCYYLDEQRRALGNESLEAADDSTARDKARRMLQSSKHQSAELWQGGRLVGVLNQRSSSDIDH
jgi:hypothetical protein